MESCVGLRTTGALKGVVFVHSLDSTVLELRTEVARLINGEVGSVKILAGARNLQDNAKTLAEYGVTAQSRLLIMHGSSASQRMNSESERAERLDKLRRAADKLAGRDGRGLSEDVELSLENQDGSVMQFKPSDQKALVLGMLMHDRGRAAMRLAPASTADVAQPLTLTLPAAETVAAMDVDCRRVSSNGAAAGDTTASGSGRDVERDDGRDGGRDDRQVKGRGDGQDEWTAALDALLMAEEAFSMVDSTLLAAIDNVAMLLIDIGWCYYQLGDVRRLGVCTDRLQRARAALQRAHGPNLERLRTLHGGFCPEMATYVRLEVLEGVVAYHSNEVQVAQAALQAAQAKWQKLQVTDASLALMQEMGYKMRESTRALRFTSGDVASAVNFVNEQRARKEERATRRKRRVQWNYDRVKYGKTASGGYVDLEAFDALIALGYEAAVAAEALRAHDNVRREALDALLDDVRRNALILGLVARSMQEALPPAVAAPAAGSGGAQGSARGTEAGPSTAASGADHDTMAAAAAAAAESDEGGSNNDRELKDVEQSLLKDVETDPMAAYDIDVDQEGAILHTYLALLSTAAAAPSAQPA